MSFVMTKPVQIRNDEVARDIREFAGLKGQPITEAIGSLVRTELARLRRRMTPADERERRIDQILAEIRNLPKLGPPLTDDDLYDEDGFPK
jgi:hypothetical protein